LLLLIQSQYLPQSVHITFTHFWMRGSLDRCHGMCVARRRRAGSGWTTAWKSRRSSPARSPSWKVRDGEELPYRCLSLSLRFMCLCCFCLESRAVHIGFALRLSCPIERDELVVVVAGTRPSMVIRHESGNEYKSAVVVLGVGSDDGMGGRVERAYSLGRSKHDAASSHPMTHTLHMEASFLHRCHTVRP
jgi:hypothetical protein